MKTFLKIIFVIFLGTFLSSGYCLAGTPVIFEWGANTESHLDGYRLYQTAVSGEYTFDEGNIIATIPAGTETYTLPDVPDGTWYWVLTAFSVSEGGMESDPSNEVTITLDTIIPNDPDQLKIQSLKYYMPLYNLYYRCEYKEEKSFKLGQELPKCPKCG